MKKTKKKKVLTFTVPLELTPEVIEIIEDYYGSVQEWVDGYINSSVIIRMALKRNADERED